MVLALLSVTSAFAAGTYDLTFSTYFGGGNWEHARDIAVDRQGNMYVVGGASSEDFPTTPGAYSRTIHTGGPANDNGRSGFLGSNGCLYVVGASDGPGWPARNAYQGTFAGGGGQYGNGDCILARLAPAPAQTITVDPAVTYQTISGWEAVAYALEPTNPAFANFRDTLLDQAVRDLGINRVRLEIRSGVENSVDNWAAYQAGTIDYQTWRSRRYATVNDDADPQTINESGFHFSEMDSTIDRIVNPLRQAAQANGEKLIANVNYVAFTGQIKDGQYLHNDPAEYAEFVLATYLHLRSKYGWVPDLWEILLEPDNVSQWNGKLLGQAIVAAAARLKAAGFEPAFVAPSNTNMGNAVRSFDEMIAVSGVLPVLRELSYHRYGGVYLTNLLAIAGRAKQHGLDSAMLEWWSNANGYETLHEDLKIGNNSAWEQGVLGGALNSEMACYKIDDSDPAHPRVLLTDKSKFLRQYYKFVRPGAVRIGAISQQGAFDPLAFINDLGSYVVVVKCSTGGGFSVGGLAGGTYGIKYTTASEFDVDLPDQTIYSGQAVLSAIPRAGVLTIYGKPTPLDDEPPSTPLNLTASKISASQIALTRSHTTGTTRLYRNGVEVAYAVQEVGSGSPLDDSSYPFIIGARGALGESTFFNGLMDEVRLYNRALSKQEIANLSGSAARPGDDVSHRQRLST